MVYVAGNCEAGALFADARWPHLAAAAAQLFAERARFSIGGPLPGFRPWSAVEASPPEPRQPPRAGETMLYTSGTTGRPKGVRRPLPTTPPPHSMAAGGAAILTAFLGDAPPASEAPHLVACPLYHPGPLTCCDGALLLGADIVVMERFDPEEFLALVEEHRPASTFLVPIQFVRLLRLPESVRRRYDLFLCDRRSDVIISGGVNIYPAQIENVLLEHPAVADCCVVGVPDAEWGEHVHALVQPVTGAHPDPAAIVAQCRRRLAGLQVPRIVELVDELPRTDSGKLARRTVRNRYWSARARRI